MKPDKKRITDKKRKLIEDYIQSIHNNETCGYWDDDLNICIINQEEYLNFRHYTKYNKKALEEAMRINGVSVPSVEEIEGILTQETEDAAQPICCSYSIAEAIHKLITSKLKGEE